MNKADRKEYKRRILGETIKGITMAIFLQPELVGSYKGYNIVDYNGLFYGVPQSLGPVDLTKEKNRSHKEVLVEEDRAELEKRIRKAVLSPPELVGSYKGYSIVDYNGLFYGVPQSLGPVDLIKEKDRSRKEVLVEEDRAELEKRIRKAVSSPPELVGNYKGYNIVDYNSLFYGVPQSLGPVDLTKEKNRSRKEILAEEYRAKIEKRIRKAVLSPPQLVGSYKGYSIVDYNGLFYGVPQSLGPVDLTKEKNRSHKEALVEEDRAELEKRIRKVLLSGSQVYI